MSLGINTDNHKKIKLPPVVHSNTTTLEIRSVTLAEDVTVLDIDAFFNPGWWIKIASDSYLQADGQKYMIRGGDGIDLDSLFWMPASGEASFSLTFDPLPIDTETFDFIESDCDDCFKIWGIDLVNNHFETPDIPEEYIRTENKNIDLAVEWKKEKAKISGKLMGFTPQIDIEPRLIYFNPITSKDQSVQVKLNDDGSFITEIEMYNPSQLMLTYNSPQPDQFWFVAAPGEETKILINLPEANRLRTNIRKKAPGYGNKMYFAGYAAQLNEELYQGSILGSLFAREGHKDFMGDILGMTLQEYSNYLLEKYFRAVDQNDKQDVSSITKEVANMQLALEVNRCFITAESYLAQAFMEVNDVSWEEVSKTISKLNKDESFNDYLTELPFIDFNKNILLVRSLNENISLFGYVSKPSEGAFGYIKFLLGSEEVKQEDKELLTDFIKDKEDKAIMPDASIAAVMSSYTDLQSKYLEHHVGIGYLSQLWNIENSLLIDLIRVNQISRKMEDYNPLTDKDKASLEKMDPVVRDVILEENKSLLAKIEENKMKTGYTVLETPDVTNENLFAEMIKPFEGKVVLVDIWATWCGPCRAANIAMEPIKAQFADQDLVYLYLAGEDSPINTWENMITDLHGYHYRIHNLGWNYLREALNARGVPTYLVIDKEGNQSYHTIGFPGSDTIKKELTKQLTK